MSEKHYCDVCGVEVFVGDNKYILHQHEWGGKYLWMDLCPKHAIEKFVELDKGNGIEIELRHFTVKK